MSLDGLLGVWSLTPATTEPHPRLPSANLYALWPGHEALYVAHRGADPSGAERTVCYRVGADGGWSMQADGGEARGSVVDDALVLDLRGPEQEEETLRLRTLSDAGRLEVTALRRDDGTPTLYQRNAVKQVVCYRRDLKMRKGKIAAQCAHASSAVMLRRGRFAGLELKLALTPEMAFWTARGSKKVVLSVEGEDALLRVHEEAEARGLPTAMIRDAGHTEFHGVPTRTAVAVGPALGTAIDVVTGPQGLVATKLA